ncbi:MAG TPA: oligosaccharide flippase family protein [Planctomycetota bacterium]|nr:oligosaccharide flippase family protein [Planctomycetota bacterium]
MSEASTANATMDERESAVAPSLAEQPVQLARTAPDGTDQHGLRSTVRRGTVWSLVGYGGSQVLRFGGNLLLTRLLVPEAFGAMALINALLVGLQLFSDIGIGPSIVQSPRGDQPAFLNTAWTMQTLRGFLLWLVACALAHPVAVFYGDPRLAWILPVAGLTALLGGFNSTRIFSAYRHVDLARISVLELISQAAGLVAMVVLALLYHSIWSLVAGGIVGTLAKLILSHTSLPGIANRFCWDKSALDQMLRFGRWIFASTLLTFLVGQSDRLIFGALIPLGALGVYSVASMIAVMPSTALGRMASGVFFPIYSRVHNAGGDLGPVFLRVRRPLLILAGWMIAGLAGGGAAAVRLLYDARYEQAGWILQWLALGSWFAILEGTNAAALLARGQSNWTAASSAGKLAGMVVLIPLGYHFGGFAGAVAGLAMTDLFKYGISAYAAARAGLKGWRQDLELTAWVLATATLGLIAAEFAQREGFSNLGAAALVFFAVSCAWIPLGSSLIALRRAEVRLEN